MSNKERLAKHLGVTEKMKVPELLKLAGFKGTPDTFHTRMRKFESVEEALNVHQPNRGGLQEALRKKLGVTTRMTVSAMLSMAGIEKNETTIRAFMRQGMTLDEAVAHGEHHHITKRAVLKKMPGRMDQTIDEILIQNGYNASAKRIRDYMRRGRTLDEAIEECLKPAVINRIAAVMDEHKTWMTIRQVSELAGCCNQTARNNLKWLEETGAVKLVIYKTEYYYCDAAAADEVKFFKKEIKQDDHLLQILKSNGSWMTSKAIAYRAGITPKGANIVLGRLVKLGKIKMTKDQSTNYNRHLYKAAKKIHVF